MLDDNNLTIATCIIYGYIPRCPAYHQNAGHVVVPPTYIAPASRHTMVARKTAYCATGSYGTVAWDIHDADRSLFVMWSAPFNSDFHKVT